MRMIVRFKKDRNEKRRGQSIIEFALFIPIYLLLITYLLQSSMALNGGAVLQQYSRQRLFEMMRNHAQYPFISSTSTAGQQGGWQRFFIGMDKDSWMGQERDEDGDRTPKATTILAGVSGRNTEDAENTFPAQTRKNIRLRIMSFVCLGPKFLPLNRQSGGSAQSSPFLSEVMSSDTFRAGAFPYCTEND